MRTIGTTQRRVIVALLVTALLPLVTAMVLANAAIRRVSNAAFQPTFRAQLDRSLVLYREHAATTRRAMEAEVSAIAARADLVAAAGSADDLPLRDALGRALETHASLVSLAVLDPEGAARVEVARARPVDERTEQAVILERPLFSGEVPGRLRAVFSTDRRRFDDATAAREFAEAYERLERTYAAATGERTYATSFGALLGLTVLLAVIVGAWVVRPVTRRIGDLVAATRPVAAGDLSVRVVEEGEGDLAELSRSFNRMLEQLEKSRARIEFLNRVGQWQTVARRLAHEIKNPLTPIQLAVEECCQRYRGDDAAYRDLLATTRDIVTEEVAALRTLVGEFAAFARLPRAHLKSGDLGILLREHWPRLERDERPDLRGREVSLALDVGPEPLPVALDRTMFHRVLANLIANATQATSEASQEGIGHVRVRARRDRDWCELVVEDDGPGVADVLKSAIFDPYVTTRKTGTGLGLSIVQKIVLDHGGTVEVENAATGGARFIVRLPIVGSPASEAALSRSHSSAWGGTGSHPGVV